MHLKMENQTEARKLAQAAKDAGLALLEEMRRSAAARRELDVRRPLIDQGLRATNELLAKLDGK
jgi:hypothetical protein